MQSYQSKRKDKGICRHVERQKSFNNHLLRIIVPAILLVLAFSAPALAWLQVYSPAEGDIWEMGKTYKIQWENPYDCPVTIESYHKGNDVNGALIAKVQSGTEFDYTISLGDIADEYKIRVATRCRDTIDKSQYADQWGYSGYFRIPPSTPTPPGQEHGFIQVNLFPADAVSAGAQWRIDNGAWHNSGDVVDSIPVGTHNLDFKPITGWNLPSFLSINVTANETAIVPSSYSKQATPPPTPPPTGNSEPQYADGYVSPEQGLSGATFLFDTTWIDPENDYVVDVKVHYRKQGSTTWANELILNYVIGTNPPEFAKSLQITGAPGIYEYQFQACDSNPADGPRKHTTAWQGGGTFEIRATTPTPGNTEPQYVTGSATPSQAVSGSNFTFATTWRDAEDDYIVDVKVHYRKQGSSSWNEVILDYVGGNPPKFSKTFKISGTAGTYEYQFQASDSNPANGPRMHTTAWKGGGTFTIGGGTTPIPPTVPSSITKMLEVPLYIQGHKGDQIWSKDRLGTCYPETIGSHGCAVTSIAMVFRYYGVNTDPRDMNNWLKANGGYSSGCLVNWPRAADHSDGRVQWVEKVDYTNVPADLNKIKSEIDKGYPVIAEVRLSGYQHFVVITGYSGSIFYINDPWYGDKFTINARYDSDPAKAIYGIRVYHGNLSAPSGLNIVISDPQKNEDKFKNFKAMAKNHDSNIYQLLSNDSLYTVKAAVADGITRIVIKSQSGEAGKTTFSVSDPSQGGLSTAHGWWYDAILKDLEVSTVKIEGSYYSFAVYTVPQELYPVGQEINRISRTINVKVKFVSNVNPQNSVEKDLPIKLLRRPLFISHGLWSDSNENGIIQVQNFIWSNFIDKNESIIGKEDFLKRVDYKVKNASHFEDSNQFVRNEIVKKHLSQLRNNNNIALNQIDWIGHSMGGIEGRLTQQDKSFEFKQYPEFSYNLINKLITVNTPHNHAYTANVLLQIRDVADDVNYPCNWHREGFSFVHDTCNAGVKLRELARDKEHPIDEGAIDDLATAPLPETLASTFAFVGNAFTSDNDPLRWLLCYSGDHVNELSGPLHDIGVYVNELEDWDYGNNFDCHTPFGINGRFPDSDIIVELDSQKGGLEERHTFFRNYAHTNFNVLHGSTISKQLIGPFDVGDVNSMIVNKLITADRSLFGAYFPKVQQITRRSQRSKISKRDRESLHLSDMIVFTLPEGQILTEETDTTVEVKLTNDAPYPLKSVTFITPNQYVKIEQPPFQTTVRVPAGFDGEYIINAYGVDTEGVELHARKVFNVKINATLLEIQPEYDRIWLNIGQGHQLKIDGVFSDGINRRLTKTAVGTTYQVSHEGIIEIGLDGAIKAISSGSTEILITNSGIDRTIEVNVIENTDTVDTDEDGMPDAWEKEYGFDPNIDDSSADADNDGLSNLDEYIFSTDPRKTDTDGDGYSDLDEYRAETDPTNPDSYPIVPLFKAGVFTVDSTGIVKIDWLYDGGKYQGEFGIFSMSGMENLTPGSPEFIAEAVKRVLSNSDQGYLAFSDLQEGARFSGILGNEIKDWNAGQYKGLKNFAMAPGTQFATILVPNSTFQSLSQNPGTEDTNKRPLFSLVSQNPAYGMYLGQMTDINGMGKAYSYEDKDAATSDWDFNDLIVQITGAESDIPTIDSLNVTRSDSKQKRDGFADWRTDSELGRLIMSHVELAQTTNPITVTLKGSATLLVFDAQGEVIGKSGGTLVGANFAMTADSQTVTLPDTGSYRIVIQGVKAETCLLSVKDAQGNLKEIQVDTALHQVFSTSTALETPTASASYDFNGDGTVDNTDVGMLVKHWNSCKGQQKYDAFFDVNDDGCITVADIMTVLNAKTVN